MEKQTNYWDGKIALDCFYCKQYRSFPSVEELREHIEKEHKQPKPEETP